MATRVRIRAVGLLDPKGIGSKLRGACDRLGIDPKTIGPHVYPNQKPENAQGTWYKKTSRVVTAKTFGTGEIERAVAFIHEHCQQRGITVPSLWPWVDWEEAEEYEVFAKLSEDAKKILRELSQKK